MKVKFSLPIVFTMFLFSAMAFAADETSQMNIVRSTPDGMSRLTESPKTVRIWFDEVPESEEWSMVIRGEGGDEYEVSYVHTMGENDLMGMLRESIPDGEYKLRWSWDAQIGEIPFTLKRPDGFVEDKWKPPLDIGIVLL